ncbi:MAG: hypothetical protein AAF434_04405 [Pseudomonadota bacterium]
MYICVDFDGTIVDHCYPDIGRPVPGAIEWMKKWMRHDAKLILYTMRADGNSAGKVLTEAVDYLREYHLHFFGVNHNPDQAEWSNSPKVYANIYVDDSALGCPLIQPKGFRRPCVDWSKVGPEVEGILKGSRGKRVSGAVGSRLGKIIGK